MGSCLLDMGAVLNAGGSKVEVCKLTHDKMGKNSLEVHLELRMQTKKSDFEYEWVGGTPVFKKAGYTMTTAGIQAPHTFVARKDHHRKVTKRPNLTMQELSVSFTSFRQYLPVCVILHCANARYGLTETETQRACVFVTYECRQREREWASQKIRL